MQPLVYVTRHLPQPALDFLAQHTRMSWWPDEQPPPYDRLVAEASNVDGLLALLTDRIDAKFLDAAPRLRIISNYAVGYDNIDLHAATERGVLVTNTPDVLTETTADFAFALMFAAARRMVDGVNYVKDGSVEDLGTGNIARSRRVWRDTWYHRRRSYRQCRRQTRPWFWHADVVQRRTTQARP